MEFYSSRLKNYKKHTLGMYITMLVIFLIFLALLILTSWFKYDKAISLFFYQAMNNSFIKGWAAYTVMDAYISVASFTVPIIFIIIETVKVYIKQKKKTKYRPWMNSLVVALYYIILTIYALGCAYQMYHWLFADHGFGPGFTYWFIAGWEYTIPIYVVSLIVNFAICFSLSWWIHSRLAKRKDFLELKHWKKGLIVAGFFALVFIPLTFIKMGTGRTYWIDIKWDEWTQKIGQYDPKRLDWYVHQNKYNFGWAVDGWQKGVKQNDGRYIYDNCHGFPSDMQDWPWWKMGRGEWVNPKPSYWSNMPSDDYAFPSGHLNEVMIIAASLLMYFRNSENKKQEQLRVAVFVLSVVYMADMFFALEVSLNHWTSDMAFSVVWAPFAFILSKIIFDGIEKLIMKVENK